MKTLEQERLWLAAVIRAELECLQTRVLQSMRALKGMTDQDLADKAGSQLPQFGDSVPVQWLEQPLKVIQEATTSLKALNWASEREREREKEFERQMETFGDGIAGP